MRVGEWRSGRGVGPGPNLVVEGAGLGLGEDLVDDGNGVRGELDAWTLRAQCQSRASMANAPDDAGRGRLPATAREACMSCWAEILWPSAVLNISIAIPICVRVRVSWNYKYWRCVLVCTCVPVCVGVSVSASWH